MTRSPPARVRTSPLRFEALSAGTSGPGRASRRGDPGRAFTRESLLLPEISLATCGQPGPATTLLEEEPMTAEQQLERSVLEGKERDELNAIAQAMSLKTTTRTKKADIIDQILDATGVTSGPPPAQATAMPSPRPTVRQAGPALPGLGRRQGRGRQRLLRRRRRRRRAPPPRQMHLTPPPPRSTPAAATTTDAASNGDSGPAVFVEPPELADGADTAPRQNGQHQNRNNQNNAPARQPEPEPEIRATRTGTIRATRTTRATIRDSRR